MTTIPADAMKSCPSCGKPRGTKKTGWTPILKDGVVQGFSCPDCPTWDEPIRRETLKDGSVRFLAVVVVRVDKQRLQRKRRFDNLEQARTWVVEIRAGLKKSADHIDGSVMTVRQMCERWLEHRHAEVGTPGGLREVTYNGYESSLNAVLMHMGDHFIREVSTDDIEAVLRKMATTGGAWKRPLSHRSITYALGSLRQAFAYAKRQKWLVENPAADAKAPGSVKKAKSTADQRVIRWTPGQLSIFRGVVDTYGDGQAFAREPWVQVGMLLTLSGLRRSEVLGLDWSSVDMAEGAVEIRASRVKTGRKSDTVIGHPKTENSHRTVRVEEIHKGHFVKALKALWLQQGRPTSGLVIADGLGPIHPDRYSRAFVRLCDEAGVPRLSRVHNVRHSLAIALQAAGVPDQQAAALLGHDVATYRKFYLVTDDDGAAEAAKAAGQLFAI